MGPDFIGIGPARSATTWLYDCLNSHPQICMAQWDKKTHFFDLYFERGTEWYENFYSHCPEGSKSGELTETYIFYDEIPQRIHEHYPDVKIFTCLRNPVDRAFSAYNHLIRDGAITDTFEQAIEKYRKALITDSLYYDRLKPYFSLFTREQIHVSFFEDVNEDPVSFLKDIYGFLGVDNEFSPPDHEQKRNVTENPRFPLLNKMMLFTHFWLRDHDLYKYFLPLKNSKIIQRIRFKDQQGPPPSMTPEARKKLHDIFDPQIVALADLIERDLSHWLLEGENSNMKHESDQHGK